MVKLRKGLAIHDLRNDGRPWGYEPNDLRVMSLPREPFFRCASPDEIGVTLGL
jgi:hypothetical protein